MPFGQSRNKSRRIGGYRRVSGGYTKAGRFVRHRRKQSQYAHPWIKSGLYKKLGSGKIVKAQKQQGFMEAALDQVINPHSTFNNYARTVVNNQLQKQRKGKPIKMGPHRHEKLKSNDASGPVNKGKGHNKSAMGVCYTHPKSRVPRWKLKRLRDYKYDVWQTVLLSKSARIPNSDNILKTFRYPIKAPECLDGERVQTMCFSPYPSAFSGIHTTFFRKIASSGTDLDHATDTPLDVIQNKADIRRHSLPQTTEATFASAIQYQHTLANGGVIDANATQTSTALANNHAFYDQIFKTLKLNLTFMSSRSFKTAVSVSVIRHIKPVAPYTWTTEDKQQLFNNLNNKGMTWEDYKVEYCHEFILPGLKKGRKPPTHDVIKTIKCNFMQTNSFSDNNTAKDMAESSLNTLGLGLRRRQTEVSDGFVSGMFYILIKYRKIQQPQQFTYSQNLQTNANGAPLARLETQALSEESFDVPVVTGQSAIQVGDTPFESNQGNEAKASFYLHGTIKYNWGYRGDDTEAIPSVMDESAAGSAKKTQSLNIDPTLTNDTNNGIYTQSQSHQTRAT